MNPVKLDCIDSDQIIIESPEKNNSLYLAAVKYNNSIFVIQSKKLQVANIDNDSIDLYIKPEDTKIFKMMDKCIIEKIATNSEEWFGKCLNTEKVTKIYKRTIRDSLETDKYILNLKLNDNLLIYSKNKPELNLSDLKINSEVIILFTIPYLVFYKTNCIPYYEVLQIKLKEENPTLQFRGDIDTETTKKPINLKLEMDEFNFN